MAEKNRSNNFDVLRLAAAFVVLAGHMPAVSGLYFFTQILYEQIQVFGVVILFLAGGFLISKSWRSDPNPVRYGLKRILRIWPALIVYCVFAACIAGPLLTSLPLKEYFQHPYFTAYFRNLRLEPFFYLAGTFESNPMVSVANGALWSLPVEVAMYVLVPVFLCFFRKASDKQFLIGWGAICVVVCTLQVINRVFYPDWHYVFHGNDLSQALVLMPYYFIGVLYTSPKLQKLLNCPAALLLLILANTVHYNSAVGVRIVQFIVFPYVTFSFALAPQPLFPKGLGKWECSYGIYLYGFLFQQIVTQIARRYDLVKSNLLLLLVSLIPTVIFAMLSYRFIEQPATRLCKKLCDRLKRPEAAV